MHPSLVTLWICEPEHPAPGVITPASDIRWDAAQEWVFEPYEAPAKSSFEILRLLRPPMSWFLILDAVNLSLDTEKWDGFGQPLF